MENAVEALKMAFAVMVFVIALSVSMVSFNRAKSTSDMVLYAQDETNYYEYQGATGKAAENRIVGLETIIPTLYKYYKENYTVLFRQANYDQNTGEFSGIKELPVYDTPSRYKTTRGVQLWGKNYDTLMQDKYSSFLGEYNLEGSKKIFSFDLEEENLRHEPWTGSYDKTRENLDCFLSGKIYHNPNNGEKYINYADSPLTTGGFIAKYKNRKFVETIGEYTYSSNQANNDGTEDGSLVSSLVKEKKKRVIIYTLIN